MSAVPKVATPIDGQAAGALLSEAFHKLTAAWPGSDVLALLLALWDLETDAGRAQANNNFGNVIALSEAQPFYWGKDSGNDRRFRSYPTAQEGADGLVGQLMRDSRKQWREGLLTGNPEKFVRALNGQDGGPSYFEAGFDRYFKTFLARWEKYRPKAVGDDAIPLRPGELNYWVLAIPGKGTYSGSGRRWAPLDDDTRQIVADLVWPEIQAQLPGVTRARVMPPSWLDESGFASSVMTERAWRSLSEPVDLVVIEFGYLGAATRAPSLEPSDTHALAEVWVLDAHTPDPSAWDGLLKTLEEKVKTAGAVVRDIAEGAAKAAGAGFGLGAAIVLALGGIYLLQRKRSK